VARKKGASFLAHKKASVGLHRNGLSIDVADVPAEDVGLVAKELLDVLRTLQAAGYDQLTMDAGAVHSGGAGRGGVGPPRPRHTRPAAPRLHRLTPSRTSCTRSRRPRRPRSRSVPPYSGTDTRPRSRDRKSTRLNSSH